MNNEVTLLSIRKGSNVEERIRNSIVAQINISQYLLL